MLRLFIALAVLMINGIVEGEQRTEHLVNEKYSTMLKIIFDDSDSKDSVRCEVYDSWEKIFEELSHHSGANIHVIAENPLSEFVNICKLVDGHIGSIPTKSITYPGTKWCGIGNTAENFDDLGPNKEADKCCREHDLCPDVLLSGQSLDGITNDGIGTISNCQCDYHFQRCLQKNGDETSITVGTLFFNVLKMKCYKFEHPVRACVRHYGKVNPTCQEYEVDVGEPKIFQFFDPRHFDDGRRTHLRPKKFLA